MSLAHLEGFELNGGLFSGAYEESTGAENHTFAYPGNGSGKADDLDDATLYKFALGSVEDEWLLNGSVFMEISQPDGTMWIGLAAGTVLAFIMEIVKTGSTVTARFKSGATSGPIIALGPGISSVEIGSAGQWIDFECRVKLATGGAGEIELRINGDAPIVDIASVTTTHSGTSTGATACAFHTNSVGHFDHLSWFTVDGTAPNDFLGPMRVGGAVVNAAGSSTQFSPVGAVTNIAAVSDGSDTSRNESATLNHKDLFLFPDVSLFATAIHGVQVRSRHSVKELSTRNVAVVMREGGGTEVQSSDVTIASRRARTLCFTRSERPATGPWTPAVLDDLEIGYKVTN